MLFRSTVNRPGKRRRTRFGWGKRPDTKRAIVSLAEGDRIDVFGPVGLYLRMAMSQSSYERPAS